MAGTCKLCVRSGHCPATPPVSTGYQNGPRSLLGYAEALWARHAFLPQTTTTLKSRCNTAPLLPCSMLVEQTGARVGIASISFLTMLVEQTGARVVIASISFLTMLVEQTGARVVIASISFLTMLVEQTGARVVIASISFLIMLVEQTGARVVIASISFLTMLVEAWEGEGGRCLARQVFQHFEGNCSSKNLIYQKIALRQRKKDRSRADFIHCTKGVVLFEP